MVRKATRENHGTRNPEHVCIDVRDARAFTASMRTLLSLFLLLGALTLTGCAWIRHPFGGGPREKTPLPPRTAAATNAPVVSDEKFTVTASEAMGGKITM